MPSTIKCGLRKVDPLWTRLSGDCTRHFPDHSTPVSLAVGMEKSVLRTLFTPLRLIRHECMRVIRRNVEWTSW
jgi:hypothetical protein